ncbi:hypothetical protein ACHAQH_009137 [Verticillium albo-atrum]
MDVEALVAQMTENLATIHTTIASLSTKEHDAKLDELEEKRDALLDALLSEYEAELEELTAQRAKEEEEIAETRRREDEEREARRKQEDDELLAKKEEQDAERRDRLARETDLVEEEADEGIDAIEAEVQKLLDEGQTKLSELEEKRKEINRLIDERMSNPLPAFVPRKRARTRAADAPADASAAAPAADADAKKDTPTEDTRAEAAKSAAPTNGLLAIEAAPNGDALKDDDASDGDASFADDTTTSKDEVSFHSPSPAGDDSGNDVKANKDASAPASDEADAEQGGEDAEPATRGVDMAADAAKDDEIVAAKEEEAAANDAVIKETVDADDNMLPAEDAETHEENKDQSIKGLSADSTDTPVATGEKTDDVSVVSDIESLKETLPTETSEPESTEAEADKSVEDTEPVNISEAVETVQIRSVSPGGNSAEESATIGDADIAPESLDVDAKTDNSLHDKSDAASQLDATDPKLVDDDALPVGDHSEDIETLENADETDSKDTTVDLPEDESEPAVDYYHTRSPEPEFQEALDDEPVLVPEPNDATDNKATAVVQEASEVESVTANGDETPAVEDLEISIASVANEKVKADQKDESRVLAGATEEPAAVLAEENSSLEESITADDNDAPSTATENKHEEDEADSLSVLDKALKSPATVVAEMDDVDEVIPTNHDVVKEDDEVSVEGNDAVFEIEKNSLNDTVPAASTVNKSFEDDELKAADELPVPTTKDEDSSEEPASVEEAEKSLSAEKATNNSTLDEDEIADANEISPQSVGTIEVTKSEPAPDFSVTPAEALGPEMLITTESVKPDDEETLATERVQRPESSTGALSDQAKSLAPTELDSAEPQAEPKVSDSTKQDVADEPAAIDLTINSVEAPKVKEVTKQDDFIGQSDQAVEGTASSPEPAELTKFFVEPSADVVESSFGPINVNESPEPASVAEPASTIKPAESAETGKPVGLGEKPSEPELTITSTASDVEYTTTTPKGPEHTGGGSSTYERSVDSEPQSSSPDEESFLEIPEDTALDDEADHHNGESPGTAKVSSSLGGDDQQPPNPGIEQSMLLEATREEPSLAFDEPSSPLVDPDTPIPSIERDYDSSDDEVDDYEADSKYEQQRSYALPEETPEPIEATTRSPAPQTATTPSVEPFIRDLDDDDDETKVEELLSAIKPQDASVELRSNDRSVSSSMDASSPLPEDGDAFSTRDLSPAESAADKTSIPDYYNTRSRSPTRVSEKSNLDASVEAGREQVKQQERPASPVPPGYVEDTAVKSFRDDMDEPQSQTAEGQIKATRASAEADYLVPVPLKTTDDALAENPAVAFDDWDSSPDASVNGDSRFSSTKTPWDATHIEHESDHVAAAGMGLSNDEDEFHLESTKLREESVKRTYDLPSMSPTKSNYDLPSMSPTKATYDLPSMSPTKASYDLPSFSRAAEPAAVDGHESRESSEQPSVLDLYQTDERESSSQQKARQDGFERDWSSLRAATSFQPSSAAESRESLPSLSRGPLATTHIERTAPLPPWPENQTESTNWQFPEEEEESTKYRDFRSNLPTSSDMNPANSTVLTDVRGQETVLEEGAYSTDASDYDSEAETEAEAAAMKRSVTSPTERFDGYIREQTIRVVDEPNAGPKSSEMTPRALQPTPLLLPRSETRDAEPSPLALRYSQSYSPTRGLAYSKHNPDRPRTPPDFDPEAFMPKDVTNMSWHARNDSVPVSLRSQSTLDTAASSPVHSALHVDRHEPTIRDSWPQRSRNDSSLTDRGVEEYDPFREAGAKFPRQTYVPPVHNQSPQRNSMSSVAPGGNSTSSPGSLFHKMRSVFEKPGDASPQQLGATETGSPIKSRPGSGVWPPVKTARPLSDLPDDNGVTGYKRHVGLFNERPEDRDENSGLLRNARNSYEGSGY